MPLAETKGPCSLHTPCGGHVVEDSQFLIDSLVYDQSARRRYVCVAGHSLYDPPPTVDDHDSSGLPALFAA